jgi:DNA-binding transcriptional MerR regulator
MRIGELGELGGVSTKTIRYYESIGLLEEPSRTPAGYRDYGAATVERIEFIRDAQASGLTLAEIASVLELKSAGERSCEHTAKLLDRHLEEIEAQIERLQSARQTLSELAARARTLDPASCTDPNRCQVISEK